MLDLFDLTGRTALCTGATSGLGRRMAFALAAAGADVVLVGRRQDKLDQAAAEIAALGAGQAASIAADLSDRSMIDTVATKASSLFGPVHILTNAAGVNLRQPYAEITFDSWDQTIDLNLAVPFFLGRALLPDMVAAGGGKIINVASLQSYRAFANSVPYGASKGGVTQLTRAMAEAWSSQGVMTNAIAPGFFETELTAPVFNNPDLVQKNAQMTAIGRNGQLADVDGLTIFLASRASDYITGQVIGLDGGFSAK